MTPLAVGYYASAILATGLGWEVARRRADHWPAAALCTLGIGSDAGRLLVQCVAADGWTLFLHNVDQGLFLAWYAGVAAVSLVVWLRRGSWPVLLGWTGVLALLVFSSPIGHRLPLEKYRLIHFAALALGIISALIGVDRTERRLTVTRSAVLLVLFAELLVFISPNTFAHWATAQVIYTAAFASLALLHAGFLMRIWIRRRRDLLLVAHAALEATEDGRRSSEP